MRNKLLATAVAAVFLAGLLIWASASPSKAKAPDGTSAPSAIAPAAVTTTPGPATAPAPAQPAATAPAKAATPRSPVAAGLRAYVDPVTGQLTAPPPVNEPIELQPPELQVPLNTSTKGLVEEPVPGPGGGFKVNLQGRFRSTSVIRADGKGGFTQECLSPSLPAGSPRLPDTHAQPVGSQPANP